MSKHQKSEMVNVNIEIPKSLFSLIQDMSKNANKQFNTQLTAKDMISKWVVQYFGTKNSLDIMSFSIERFGEDLDEYKDKVSSLFDNFQKTAITFDDISQQTNSLFIDFIRSLEKIDSKTD